MLERWLELGTRLRRASSDLREQRAGTCSENCDRYEGNEVSDGPPLKQPDPSGWAFSMGLVKLHLNPYDIAVKSEPQPGRLRNYLFGTIVGIFVLRAVKLAYERSRLDRMIGRVIGDNRVIKLDQAFVGELPKTSLDIRGRATEPLNFIFLGERAQIRAAFRAAGWQEPVAITAGNWAHAFWAGLRDQPYPKAPFTPYYISTSPQNLAFQQETPRHSIHERHHLRIWQTNFQLAGGTKLWLGMASFDTTLKLVNGFKFPYHHIDPDLDKEREYILDQLLTQGSRERARFTLTEAKTGQNDHGDEFYTDGQIVVVDVTKVKHEA